MIADNLKIVREKVTERCEKIGRNPDEIRIVAVSKTQPLDVINQAISAGVIDLGENKAQELKEKAEKLSEKLNWHFIGHLQTNKVKFVTGPAFLIHSVDSPKLADEINKRASAIGKVQKVLLEVNVSGEHSKFGLNSLDEIKKILEYCSELPNLEVSGLMTMAPYTGNEVVIRQCFSGLRGLIEKPEISQYGLKELSMGMTNDFEIAIDEGATILRIGTAIFGERNYAVQL